MWYIECIYFNAHAVAEVSWKIVSWDISYIFKLKYTFELRIVSVDEKTVSILIKTNQ